MSLRPEDVREAVELAEANAVERLEALADVMAPDGLTWDQDELSDAEFVPWFLDLTTHPDPEFSVMHFLPSVAPKLYESLATRYERIVAKGGA